LHGKAMPCKCKPGTFTVTSRMTGAFRSDPATREEFLAMIGR
jgi:GTP cyclohydrolase I